MNENTFLVQKRFAGVAVEIRFPQLFVLLDLFGKEQTIQFSPDLVRDVIVDK